VTEQQATELSDRVRELIARGDARLRVLLREQVIVDWIIQLARQEGAPGWLALLAQDAANGELGPKMRSWIKDVAASADYSATQEESLGYALGMVDVVLDTLAGSLEALKALKRLTGRNFAREFKKASLGRGHPADNPREDTLAVLFELICEISDAGLERGHRPIYADQRAALATAIDNAISDHTGGKRKRLALEPLDEDKTTAPITTPQLTEQDQDALWQQILAAAKTEKQRALLQLRLQGKEGQGLADALGKSLSATEKLQARAIKEVRKKIIGGDGGDL
jgi:hypothetical protein